MPLPSQASVVIAKSMGYRGGTKTFHNRYYLNSTTGPASTAAWNTLFDAIVAAEKAIYQNYVTIVLATGYEGGTNLPAASKVYSQAGTASFTNYDPSPGDAAAMIRYSTTQRTTKNHPVYLFNWYHGIGRNTLGSGDDLNGGQKTAMETYASAWLTGFSDGTNTYKKSGPFGAVGQVRTVSPYIRHRDFLS